MSLSIPEELIRIQTQIVLRKRQRQRRLGTSESDREEAIKYLEKHQWKIFWWEVRHPNSRDFAVEIVKTLISAFGLITTIVAVAGLYLTYQGSREDRKNVQKDRELAQERLVTDRFSKAVEQLENTKDITVRIGGIYALERIAKDSDRDFWTIMEVLTSYVRENSPLPPEALVELKKDKIQEQLKNLPEVKIDVQAALTVIGRSKNPESNRDEKIDLSFTNLKGADLKSANLQGAKLNHANLGEAKLNHANLQKVVLYSANLQGAKLNHANLQKAFLTDAYNLDSEQIKSACFWKEAIYKDWWSWTEKTQSWIPKDKQSEQKNTNYIKYLEEDKSTDPVKSPECSRWQG